MRLQHNIHDEAVARFVGLPRKDNRYVVTFALGLGGSIVSPPPVFKNVGLRILDALISESTLPKPSEQVGTIEEENEETGDGLSLLYTNLLNRRTVREYAEGPLSRKTVLALEKAATCSDRLHQSITRCGPRCTSGGSCESDLRNCKRGFTSSSRGAAAWY